MAIYHLEAKVISRGNGRSACAAAAYMSCSAIYNDYDGIRHDYTRKQGLVWQQIFLPENAPSEWHDREVLWNAVEANENTKDSRLAREFIVALPIELDADAWKNLLTDYIREQFVADGMCADVCIHDTDGHNPHAHILLTVRPLDEQGRWQYKTQKEYLCIRDGKEQGFTADEFKTAQDEGWEKQYRYFPEKGKKKIYLTPSEADRRGLTRADKHPKSTRYGRQNPISARWNSEEQLSVWREAWARTANRYLEQADVQDRIDHRSNADRGIEDTPTIHEGVAARAMEQKDIPSDRCELNREIKAGNRLIRELKAQMRKLSQAVAASIESIAETLENIRSHMIAAQYHLLHNQDRIEDMSERYEWNAPIIKEYKELKNQLEKKQHEKRDLTDQKKKTGTINPLQHIQLSRQITTLTEDIEELKSRKTQLMYDAGCHSAAEMKDAENTLAKMADYLEKLDAQQTQLTDQLDSDETQFSEIQKKVDPDQKDALLDVRAACRNACEAKLITKLRDKFSTKFRYDRLDVATGIIDSRLGDDSDLIQLRSLQLIREQIRKQGKIQLATPRKKSKETEL